MTLQLTQVLPAYLRATSMHPEIKINTFTQYRTTSSNNNKKATTAILLYIILHIYDGYEGARQ